MRDLVDFGIEKLEREDVRYGDIRLSEIETEVINVKNGAVEAIKSSESRGYGIRVIDGGWGFASSADLSEKGIEETIKRAKKIARASSKASGKIDIKDIEVFEDTYTTPYEKDPFKVELEEKLDLLMEVDDRLDIDDKIKVRKCNFNAWKTDKIFASTEGAMIEQELVKTGGGLNVNVSDGEDTQKRSYPNAFGGDFHSSGYEFFESLDLLGNAEETAQEGVDLLDAEQCPEGEMDIILNTNQLALQVHESAGHPTELDRALGTEASYAGTSFLTPDKLEDFRYGAENVNIVSDATAQGGLGTFGYDDEGARAKKIDLVKDGLFVGYQASREGAAEVGVDVSGNMRADGWENLPIVRMTNINLEPGDWTKDEIVEETDRGIIFDGIKSWSIDDKRLNFQFGTEAGYLVEDGEITELIKNPTYTGITYEFWKRCDAIAGEEDWRLHGVPNCGKGEPPQTMQVGHGCAPSRFSDIRVGVGEW
ncbi:MAG: TldD/PmbA family protein [Candidatus Thermoplasmatota archaeon]|nr:TldD/PmbA family protein [Candidatus Thermoplasmatota archaeon]